MINYYYLLAIILSILLVVFIIYVRFGSPIVSVTGRMIKFMDFLIPEKIWGDSIKSIKLLDRMPAIRRGHEMYRHRYNPAPPKAGVIFPYKGFCQVYTDNGVKYAISYARDYKNCCIEIDTTRGLIYINYKNEEKTRRLYEKIITKVIMVGEDELKTYEDRSGLIKLIWYVVLFGTIIAISLLFD